MRYDCRDIVRLLESDEHISLYSFEQHLAGCLHCRKLVELDPQVEEHLQTRLPGTSPPSLCKKVMKAVRMDDSRIRKGNQWERALPLIAGVTTCSLAALIMLKWDEIKSVILSIDPGFLRTVSLDVISNFKLLLADSGRLISYVGNEPFIYSASLGAAALIWALSFLELERSPK